MFCPRCGAESDEGSRYCASCGVDLPQQAESPRQSPAGPPGFRGRLERVVGTTHRTKMLTVGTMIAIAIAIAAFIALSPASNDAGSVPQDAYTKALDTLCVQRKVKIAAAQRKALTGGSLNAVSRYADSMVPIVGEWWMELDNLVAPADRAEPVDELKSALLEVEIEAGTLARVARESDRRGVATTAARVDAATANVEATIASLGLERCGRLTFDQGQLIRQ